MQWEPKPDSQAAIDDAAQHDAFIRKCAEELAANKPPPRTPTPIRSGITQTQLNKALSKLCATIAKAIRQMVVEPLQKQIADLEQKQLKLGGVWKDGQRYKENTLVTHAGGLWLALADTDTRPGRGSPAWRLAVKRGDAK